MAAGCCGGVKKQKVASETANKSYNSGYTSTRHGSKTRVVTRDMCVYCFDVLASYLQFEENPKPPKFANEKL